MLYTIRIMAKKPAKQKIVVVVGPTASGKSDLAIRLAKLAQGKTFKKYGILGAEMVSVDSRQVYRGMDIGTGKVKKDKKNSLHLYHDRDINADSKNSKKLLVAYFSNGIRHHLIDVANPRERFTADDFKRLGQKAIQNIVARGKIPIIVGGTGFYIDVLLGRMRIAGVPPNKKLRARLEKQSTDKLFKQLSALDPQRSKSIDRHNKRRLIRALEIVLTTGKPVLPLKLQPSESKRSTDYAIAESVDKSEILWIGLKTGDLEKKIKNRLNKRLKQGMVQEVEKLRRERVSWKRLDDLGLEYRWISRYLKTLSAKCLAPSIKSFQKSEYYQKLLIEIVNYSKRQMTWFNRNKNIYWLNDNKIAERLTRRFLRT